MPFTSISKDLMAVVVDISPLISLGAFGVDWWWLHSGFVRISRLGDLPLFIHRPKKKVIHQYDKITSEHESTGAPQVMLDEDPPVIEEVIALDEAIMEEESPNI
uniref:Uncharacterized protein n=1 Tax=Rhodnius prolixus TaxID=13249 RepID=T1ICA2_RHOPR